MRAIDQYLITITVGHWDVWRCSHLDLETAKSVLHSSVQSLFAQLRIAVGSFDEPITIVLPSLVDVSFTPKFVMQLQRPGPEAQQMSEMQHKLVYLTDYWNMALAQHAATWSSGHIYIPNWHTWLLNEVRSTQMKRAGLFDGHGLGTETPAFKDVSSPCLKPVFEVDESNSNGVASSVRGICELPRQHLWW